MIRKGGRVLVTEKGVWVLDDMLENVNVCTQ